MDYAPPLAAANETNAGEWRRPAEDAAPQWGEDVFVGGGALSDVRSEIWLSAVNPNKRHHTRPWTNCKVQTPCAP